MLALEQRLEVQAERQLDRLARRARRGDDDDATRGMGRMSVGVGIGGKMVVARRVQEGMNARRRPNANA
jgi:hypothetical protein